MKRMLISLLYNEELRIALIDNNNYLYNLYIDNAYFKSKKYNIYKGKVVKIEQGLEAAFIDYGENKNGFLSIKEIYKNNLNSDKKNIKDLLNVNQEIIVQIIKEEKNDKCAYLTTFISLAGSYIVLTPNNNNICISKKIDIKNKKIIKDIISDINLYDNNIGYIIRTSCLNKTLDVIQKDLDLKIKQWNLIQDKYINKKDIGIIYDENNFIIKILRDNLYDDIEEIIIDDYKIYNLIKEYLNILGKSYFIKKITLYNINEHNFSMFSKYNLHEQIESIFKKKIILPSGGSIIIENTEALTAIDINSSKYKKGVDIEETALNTNLEASKEISKQLILRNLSGLIVIDFIDMSIEKNIRKIETAISKYFNDYDKAKIKINNISKFGLLELTRQRINGSINDYNYYKCNECEGYGKLRTNNSISIYILGLIEKEILNDKKKIISEIHIITTVSIGTYLLNEKRDILNALENITQDKNKIKIIIVPFNIKNNFFKIFKVKNKKDKKSNYSYILPILYDIKKNNNYIKIENYIKYICNKRKYIFNNKNINHKYNIFYIIKNILLFIKNIFL